MTVSPYASPAMASLLPMQSLLGLPLIVGNQKLGAALIGFNTRHVFTEPEIQRSAQAASQVALALSKARLFEATQRRAEEFATLYETSNVLSIQQDLNVLLHTIVQRAVALLNTGEGLIYLYDEKNQELEVAAAEQTGIPAGTRLPLSAGGASVEVVRTRQPIIVNDYRTWEHRRRELEAYSIASLVRVPILYAGELLGVLGVSEIGETTRKFNADDVRLLSLFAAQAAGAIHDRRLFAETRQRVAELEAVNLVSRALYRAQNMSEMLPILLDQTLAVMHTDAGAIWLSDLPPDTISRPIARGWFARQDGTRLKRGEGIAGHVVETGKVYFAKEFATDPRTCPSARAICPPGWGGACVPIRTGQETIGAMFVSAPNPRELNPNEAHLLTTLAEIAGNAIHRTRLNESLQDAYDTTLEGWARALELRDRETEGHTRRVTGMAIQLARAMGMNGEDLVQLRRGALLHDIGKMGIPDQILLKTGPLTRAQWKIMHQHPEYAHKMLANIPFLRSALDVPYCHHEKWDGSGYLRGLAGEAIPLAARIFAIVDVWDALLSDRPYRPAWTEADAKDYLRTQAGMHFDPQVVSAFFKVVIND